MYYSGHPLNKQTFSDTNSETMKDAARHAIAPRRNAVQLAPVLALQSVIILSPNMEMELSAK